MNKMIDSIIFDVDGTIWDSRDAVARAWNEVFTAEHVNLQVDVAVNGEEGVTHFLSHEPGYYDVILMDIRMPVMDGLTATRKIRESGREEGKTVPIVAMTANVFEEDVRKSLDAGMDAHLSKPIEITQMYAVLDSMIYR